MALRIKYLHTRFSNKNIDSSRHSTSMTIIIIAVNMFQLTLNILISNYYYYRYWVFFPVVVSGELWKIKTHIIFF